MKYILKNNPRASNYWICKADLAICVSYTLVGSSIPEKCFILKHHGSLLCEKGHVIDSFGKVMFSYKALLPNLFSHMLGVLKIKFNSTDAS